MSSTLRVAMRPPSQIKRLPEGKTEADLKEELKAIREELGRLAPAVDRLRERRQMIESLLR